MTGKGIESLDMIERRKAVLCVQETLFYYCVDRKRNGVEVIMKKEFVSNV